MVLLRFADDYEFTRWLKKRCDRISVGRGCGTNEMAAQAGLSVGVVCLGTPFGYRVFLVLGADGKPRISAGCRWFTMAEARSHWTSMSRNRQAGPRTRARARGALKMLDLVVPILKYTAAHR